MEGRLIKDRYRLDSPLGEGAMGAVFKAFDLAENRVVAVKITRLPASHEASARFQREARALLDLKHPNIVRVYDAGEHEGYSYIVMEYLSGKPLADAIPLPIADAVELAIQIGEALDYAHGRGIIHRDIKPANLMVSPIDQGRPGLAIKVTDFGLARRLHDQFELSESGMLVGTAAYISPEQALGQRIDTRSDLYSLGAVLFEALTGQTPFPGDDFVAVIYQHLNEAPPPPRRINAQIPPSLEQIVLRLLRKEPTERFSSAAELVTSLHAVRAEPASATQAGNTLAPASESQAVAVAVGLPLIGRDHELGMLKETIRQTRRGVGQTVLIAGEEGIGKTRLVQEAVAFARLHRFQVLSAVCYDHEGKFPFQPFIDGIRSYAMRLHWQDLDVLRQATQGFGGELCALTPELAKVYGESASIPKSTASPEQEKERLFEAVRRLVAGISQLSPVLLLVDDLQWADPSSLQLLRYLALRSREQPILILATYRSAAVTHPLTLFLDSPNGEKLYSLISLGRLSPERSVALVQALLGAQPISPPVGHTLYAETEGNPFFLMEIVRHLLEEGLLVEKDRQWQLLPAKGPLVSASVREVVERRLALLPSSTRSILAFGAVIGRAFSFALLRQLASAPDADLLTALDRALASGLVRERSHSPRDRYDFSHGLIRDALYSGLAPAKRRLLHRRLGQILERQTDADGDKPFGELAYHFSDGRDRDKAIKYNYLAGQQAACVYATEDAFRYFSAAHDLVGKRGQSEYALDILEGLGRMAIILGQFEVAVDAFEQAIRAASADQPTASGRLITLRGEVSAALERLGRYDEGLDELQRGLSEAEEAGIAETVEGAYLHGQLAVIYSRRGEIDLAMQHARQDLDIAEKLGDEEEVGQACTILYKLHSLQGDWEGARRLTEKALDIWTKRNDVYRQEWNYLNLGAALWALGHWEEARENWLTALGISQRIQYTQGIVQNCLNLGLLGLRRGDLLRAEEFLGQAQELADQMGHPYYLARAIMRLAELRQQQGTPATALEFFARAESILRGIGHKTGLSELLWVKADACVEQGQLDQAEQAAEEALALAPQPDGYEEIGNARRVLARVWLKRGDRARAGDCLQRAMACMDALRDAYGQAQTRFDLASFILGGGAPPDLAKARTLLQESLDGFERLQALPYISKVGAALHELGASTDQI